MSGREDVPYEENINDLDEVASSKLNLHGGFFRKYSHLGLFEAKPTCVIRGLARYSFVCFRSKRVGRFVWCRA